MSSVDNIGCFLTVRSIMIGQVSTPTASSIHKNYAWLHFYLYTKNHLTLSVISAGQLLLLFVLWINKLLTNTYSVAQFNALFG